MNAQLDLSFHHVAIAVLEEDLGQIGGQIGVRV